VRADPDKEVKIDGNDHVITGDIYSGDDVLWPGNTTTLYGDLHAQDDLVMSGSGTHISDDDNPATAWDETNFGGDVTYGDSQTIASNTIDCTRHPSQEAVHWLPGQLGPEPVPARRCGVRRRERCRQPVHAFR
jgi:hypothetical protein